MVFAPYSVNLFRPLDSQICRENFNFVSIDGTVADIISIDGTIADLDCVRKRMSAALESLSQSQWPRNTSIEREWVNAGLNLDALKPDCPVKFCLEMITRSPFDPKIYNVQLLRYNEILTESIKEEVSTELSYQFKKDANFVMTSEAYAENNIKLRRLLNGIERGQMAINFEEIEINKVVPPSKQALIMVLSLILGGFLGCAVVLIRAAIFKKRAVLG